MEPAHGPPLQARVAAANGTVLAACKLLVLHKMILAHMAMNRGTQKQNERGRTEMGSGYGRQRVNRHTAC